MFTLRYLTNRRAQTVDEIAPLRVLCDYDGYFTKAQVRHREHKRREEKMRLDAEAAVVNNARNAQVKLSRRYHHRHDHDHDHHDHHD